MDIMLQLIKIEFKVINPNRYYFRLIITNYIFAIIISKILKYRVIIRSNSSPNYYANNLIKKEGRLLVRKSGTEPKIRIMGESKNKKLLNKCINIIKKSIK